MREEGEVARENSSYEKRNIEVFKDRKTSKCSKIDSMHLM